jgi:outer membrane protein OmpA-like peptidoglycan-associated protein/tetratricopeptide (TPR) repeat protein
MKNMKNIFAIIVFVFSLSLVQAQNRDMKRAKRYFDRTYYSEAIPLYEAIAEKNTTAEVIKNLADSYYYTNELKKAQKYYRFLIKNYSKDLNEEYYFRFSQTLKASGNYDETNDVMKAYFQKSSNDTALANFEKQIKKLENISAIGARFEIKNLAVNTPQSEFGALMLGDKLIYAGVKKIPGTFDKVYKWNNEGYLDLVAVPVKDSDTKEAMVNYFAKELNTPMHESNAVFTKDGKTMYFTRNNYKNGQRKKNNKKVSTLQIFKAELVNGKWSNIKPLPFNSDNYSVEHPALSNDEKILYFASDMPGTLGSLDIFSVAINDGFFGTPKNLGDKINTNRKEQFPFISKDNKLYFSSNGHAGYGSLDVFVSAIENDGFSKPLNVGNPVNSGMDDFAFTIDPDTQEGYFSSNRPGGKGSDDIYFITEIKPLIIEDCKQSITGVITDVDTGLPLNNAIVILQTADKNEVEKTITATDGKFNFSVACEAAYTVLGSKDNYTNNTVALKLDKQRNVINDASMALKSFSIIKKEEERKEKIIAEQKKKKEEEAVAKDKEIAAVKKKEKIEKIIAEEKDVVKEKDRLIIKTDPIYFDYNLWYIRKESKIILNRIVELMKKYPDMVVEIGSHTDARGDNTFNKNLSQKRATSTMEYILSQGIAQRRISAKGYGESVPIIKCIPESSCTEEQHELNRRSEFVIKDL